MCLAYAIAVSTPLLDGGSYCGGASAAALRVPGAVTRLFAPPPRPGLHAQALRPLISGEVKIGRLPQCPRLRDKLPPLEPYAFMLLFFLTARLPLWKTRFPTGTSAPTSYGNLHVNLILVIIANVLSVGGSVLPFLRVVTTIID